MSNSNMLIHLAAQADARGADLVTLRAMIEEASDLGAARALARLGLSDDHAAKDMAELRELLSAWRDAKKTMRKAVLGWLARIALALLLMGLAVKLGLTGLMLK
ncbi:MAG: hypothetical protein RL425_1321 [Pseudomonadota bacterium]|jgi:hypothetical protein